MGSIILSIFAIRLRSLVRSRRRIDTTQPLHPINPKLYFKGGDPTVDRISFDPNLEFNYEKLRKPWNYEELFKSKIISLITVEADNASKARFIDVAMIYIVISVALTVATVIAIFSLPSQKGNGELTCKELSTTTETRIINGTNIFTPSPSNKESKVLLCMSK